MKSILVFLLSFLAVLNIKAQPQFKPQGEVCFDDIQHAQNIVCPSDLGILHNLYMNIEPDCSSHFCEVSANKRRVEVLNLIKGYIDKQ